MAETQRSRPEMGIPRAAATLRVDSPSVARPADTHPEHAICWPCLDAAIQYGVDLGIRIGREHERAERHAEALHHRAYVVVQAMAKIPPRDADADARAADQRSAWWEARRSA